MQDHEAVKDAKGRGGDGQEVNAHRFVKMRAKERVPAYRRALFWRGHVLGDGGLRYDVSQECQLGLNPGCTLDRVFSSHALD